VSERGLYLKQFLAPLNQRVQIISVRFRPLFRQPHSDVYAPTSISMNGRRRGLASGSHRRTTGPRRALARVTASDTMTLMPIMPTGRRPLPRSCATSRKSTLQRYRISTMPADGDGLYAAAPGNARSAAVRQVGQSSRKGTGARNGFSGRNGVTNICWS
jgi:hypothetical protein